MIYEDGNYAEVGFQHLFFSANGTDIVGNRTGNIANDITLGFFNVKFDVTEKLAFALAVDQPLDIGISTILQADDVSHWALKHTGEKPDFHRRDSFSISV